MLKGKKLESNLTSKYTSFISPASVKQYNLDPGLPTEMLLGSCRLNRRGVFHFHSPPWACLASWFYGDKLR